ncbi:MAG: Stp1/IreP family PP2C-type Ser/Thr phosphatase [Lachnospiraceae bacterium]|nr:Stp1/IreP family PP2C-type Ser/Thr phosphatase [Lachnospiraceae bacterium]
MKAYGKTDVGSVRAVNQDVIFYSDTPVGALANLFIVADGMGGHRAGDVASALTVETIVNYIRQSEETNPITLMEEGIRRANLAVIDKAFEDEDYEGMGTTVVAATLKDDLLYVANVGDSRLYLLNEEIHQITRDHSYVADLVSLGQLDRENARESQKKNIITRAVGAEPEVTPDFFEVEVKPNDKFLLCSDGLTNMVRDDEIKKVILAEDNLGDAVVKLIDIANEHGGKDNISAVLASV